MPPNPRAALGANIRAEIARRGKSQADLAEQIGLGQSQMSKRLAGTIAFNIDELYAIAEALDVPLSVLLPAGQEVAP